MSTALLGLTAGFILLLIMLSVLLLKVRYPLVIKLFMIVAVSGFYWIQYESLLYYSGWPVKDDLPERFVLIASFVQEPNTQTGEPGKLFWWIRDNADPSIPPRAIELPYRNELHEDSAQVLEDQEKGAMYVGKKVAQQGEGRGIGVEFEKINTSERFKK